MTRQCEKCFRLAVKRRRCRLHSRVREERLEAILDTVYSHVLDFTVEVKSRYAPNGNSRAKHDPRFLSFRRIESLLPLIEQELK